MFKGKTKKEMIFKKLHARLLLSGVLIMRRLIDLSCIAYITGTLIYIYV